MVAWRGVGDNRMGLRFGRSTGVMARVQSRGSAQDLDSGPSPWNGDLANNKSSFKSWTRPKSCYCYGQPMYTHTHTHTREAHFGAAPVPPLPPPLLGVLP